MPSGLSTRVEIIPPGRTLSDEDELVLLDHLATLLDSQFVIPGTNVRFGLDGILGLVPVVGDILSAFISFYLISRAAKLGLSRWTKFRMVANVTIDTVLGSVPILGDMFDVGFKSNKRNIALARRALAKRNRRR